MDIEPYPPDDDYADHPAEPTVVVIRRAPTVWPVFVAFAATLGVSIGVQVAAMIALVAVLMIGGAKPDVALRKLVSIVTTAEGFVVAASVSQIFIGMGAVVASLFQREPLGSSLGMGKPQLSFWAYPIVVIGAFAPGLVGAGLALALAELLPPDDSLDKVCDSLTWTSVVPFVLFIGLAPGFCEEILFRGFMQRRLLAAWSPWGAILMSSLLFGVMHIMPHQVVFAFVIGLWLGFVAWRTGSIWPSMLCHAAWNCCAVALAVGLKWTDQGDYPPQLPSLLVGVLVLVCFAASIWILLRRPAPIIGDADVPVAELAEEGANYRRGR